MDAVIVVLVIGLGTALLALVVGAPLLYVFDNHVWPAVVRAWDRMSARFWARPRNAPGDKG